MLRETLLALLVLAVAFLNFGYDSASFAADGTVVVGSHATCGDASGAPDSGHFACHACRPDAVALPPAPVEAAPIVFAPLPVVYAEAPGAGPTAGAETFFRPRGPPAA